MFGGFEASSRFATNYPYMPVVVAIHDYSPAFLFSISPFLHGSFTHYAWNLVLLVSFGLLIERTVGWIPFTSSLLVITYVGSLLSTLVQLKHGAQFPQTIGISGGVYALLGFSTIWLRYSITKIKQGSSLSNLHSHLSDPKLFMPIGAALLILSAMQKLQFGAGTSTNQFGHVVGASLGIVLAYLYWMGGRELDDAS